MDELWPLFRAVAAQGEPAWPALVEALHPVLLPIAADQPVGRLRGAIDTRFEIVTRVLERLHARELAAIVKLCAQDPPPPLAAWLRVLVRRAAIDYLRGAAEYRRATAEVGPRWITLSTLTSSSPDRGPDSLAEKRIAVTAFIRAAVARAAAAHAAHGEDAIGQLAAEWSISRTHIRRLVQRGPRYLQVLDAVLAGHSYPDVAGALGVTRREVELTVHYIEELLAARRFAI